MFFVMAKSSVASLFIRWASLSWQASERDENLLPSFMNCREENVKYKKSVVRVNL